MKKFIIALMLVVSLAGFAAQAHAVTLDDLWREITSLRQQVSDMKTQLGAAVIRASDMITSSKIDASLTTDATKISTTSVTAKPTGIIGVMQPITADGLTPTIKQTTTTTDPVVGGGQLQPTAVDRKSVV